MPHILGNDAVVSVICGLVVAFYAARRYDTPDTNRHTTTRMMFYMSEAGYVLASLVLFMVLAWAIRDPSVLALLGLANLDGHYSPPVLATLVLTTLLPNVTLLRTGNSWLLGRFQAWGRIPHGASNLADKLQSELLSLSPGALNAVEDWIARSPDVPSNWQTMSPMPALTDRRQCWPVCSCCIVNCHRWRRSRVPANLGWIVSALAAGSIGFLLSRCAIAVTHHGIAAAWDFAAWPVAPTGPMTAAIALSTAIICDLKVAFARPGIRRLVEGNPERRVDGRGDFPLPAPATAAVASGRQATILATLRICLRDRVHQRVHRARRLQA